MSYLNTSTVEAHGPYGSEETVSHANGVCFGLFTTPHHSHTHTHRDGYWFCMEMSILNTNVVLFMFFSSSSGVMEK